MKAKLTGKINRIVRNNDKIIIKDSDMVEIDIDFTGQIEDVILTAKQISMKATLKLKPIIADKLLFGSNITINLSDEEALPTDTI